MQKLVIMTSVLFTACGGSSSVSPEDYVDAVRDARCRYLVKCGQIESADTCKKINIGGIGGAPPIVPLDASIRAAIDRSMTKYDGEKVAACLDAFATRDCDATSQSGREIPDECLQVLAGTLHDGETCAQDAECISLQCDVLTCDDNLACCSGTCTGDAAPVRAKLGESCETAFCDDTLFCDDASLTCVALKGADAFCVSPAECAFGLDCLPTGTCAALPKLGDPCTGPCREGAVCNMSSRTCVKVALAGEACTMSADCSPIYHCDASKHCSLGPKVGDPCTVAQPCGDDLAFCDTPPDEVMGTCALPKPDGEPCQLDSNCKNQYCDPATLLCAPEPVCI